MVDQDMDQNQLTHVDRTGRARMVDVSAKTANVREAEASAFVAMSSQVLGALGRNPKGDPLETARLAGINVDRIKTLGFIISGMCAALTGTLLASRLGSGTTSASPPGRGARLGRTPRR